MPDILIQCPECSREYKVSEYATVDNMTCVTCGAGLARPSAAKDSGTGPLRLKSNLMPPSLPGVESVAAGVPDALAIAGGPTIYAAPQVDVHQVEEVKSTPHWIAYVVGALVLAILVGFQYYADRFGSYLTYYLWIRNGLAAASYGFVVLLAFQDHWGPGLVNLLIPPYALLYTASSIESGILRGAFYAMVAVFAAEVHFMPDESGLLALGGAVTGLIENVDALIVKASDSPV